MLNKCKLSYDIDVPSVQSYLKCLCYNKRIISTNVARTECTSYSTRKWYLLLLLLLLLLFVCPGSLRRVHYYLCWLAEALHIKRVMPQTCLCPGRLARQIVGRSITTHKQWLASLLTKLSWFWHRQTHSPHTFMSQTFLNFWTHAQCKQCILTDPQLGYVWHIWTVPVQSESIQTVWVRRQKPALVLVVGRSLNDNCPTALGPVVSVKTTQCVWGIYWLLFVWEGNMRNMQKD